jgi:hypothetical protein
MDDLGIIDNIEGLTLVQNWLMANSSLFVSDNNFYKQNASAFEVDKTVF